VVVRKKLLEVSGCFLKQGISLSELVLAQEYLSSIKLHKHTIPMLESVSPTARLWLPTTYLLIVSESLSRERAFYVLLRWKHASALFWRTSA
jgi:hypothetical protein